MLTKMRIPTIILKLVISVLFLNKINKSFGMPRLTALNTISACGFFPISTQYYQLLYLCCNVYWVLYLLIAKYITIPSMLCLRQCPSFTLSPVESQLIRKENFFYPSQKMLLSNDTNFCIFFCLLYILLDFSYISLLHQG